MSRVYIFLLLSCFLFGQANSAKEGRVRAEALLKNTTPRTVPIQEKMKTIRYKNLPPKYKYLPDLVEKIKKDEPILVINYLTSSSVPINSHLAFSRDTQTLKDNFRVSSKICMIGIEHPSFPSFVSKLMNAMSEQHEDGMGIDFCPNLFEDANVTRVPAYIVTVCKNKYVHPEECRVKYVLRGDVTLRFVMEKLSDQNKYFKDMYEAL